MKKLENFVNRVLAFWDLWGSYHYENRIDASLAWELAGIFIEHADALEGWERLDTK